MNFDNTIVGKPFIRTNKIIIDYPEPNTAKISVTNQECVKLLDGSYVTLGAESTINFDVHPENMGDSLSMSDTNTGESLGAYMTYGQIMLGILAAIRAHV